MELSLFEYELSSGFNWTNREQEAITKLEKILGDRLFDLTIYNGNRELKARQYVGVPAPTRTSAGCRALLADLGEDLVVGDATAAEVDLVAVRLGEIRHELSRQLVRFAGSREHEDLAIAPRLLWYRACASVHQRPEHSRRVVVGQGAELIRSKERVDHFGTGQ